MIFNIEENQDERTDNFVKVNMKSRKPDKEYNRQDQYNFKGEKLQSANDQRANSKHSRKSNSSIRKNLPL